MTAKTNSKTVVSGKVRGKRLTPEEHIPTAQLGLIRELGTFGVEVTTGRQKETLLPVEADTRVDALRDSADHIAALAKRARKANTTDEGDGEVLLTRDPVRGPMKEASVDG